MGVERAGWSGMVSCGALLGPEGAEIVSSVAIDPRVSLLGRVGGWLRYGPVLLDIGPCGGVGLGCGLGSSVL